MKENFVKKHGYNKISRRKMEKLESVAEWISELEKYLLICPEKHRVRELFEIIEFIFHFSTPPLISTELFKDVKDFVEQHEPSDKYTVFLEKGLGKLDLGLTWAGGVDNPHPPTNDDGFIVRKVWGQAQLCGIKKYDRITDVNGQSVHGFGFHKMERLMNAKEDFIKLSLLKSPPRAESPPRTPAQIQTLFSPGYNQRCQSESTLTVKVIHGQATSASSAIY